MRAILFAATALLFVAADAPKNDAKKEMAQLEGQWSMVSGLADGQPMPEPMVKTMRRVAKDGVTTVTQNDQIYMKAKFTIDADKKPKTIDYQVSDGPTKGKTQLGIYEIEGDTVKFCFARPDQARPTDFTSKPGSGWTSSVWKRDKK
ncbi:MAG: TIGR03067 domain-containing protein [Gemmataceae bacterium]